MSTTPTLEAVSTVPPERNDVLYEVVNGKRVELPPMGIYESGVASILMGYLEPFTRTHQLGRSRVEALFQLTPVGDIERRPDLAFISYQRWAKNRPIPRANAWAVVPELAVEVVSPSNLADEIQARIHEYFRAGVQLVWVVFPRQQQVHVYTSPTQVRILDRNGELDGGAVVPGFQLPVAALFEDELEPSPP
jgi:Uma2 family endonuclease